MQKNPSGVNLEGLNTESILFGPTHLAAQFIKPTSLEVDSVKTFAKQKKTLYRIDEGFSKNLKRVQIKERQRIEPAVRATRCINKIKKSFTFQ